MAEPEVGPRAVILYDGECGVCGRAMAFASARCSAARLRFIPLESDAARELLGGREFAGGDADTMFAFPSGSRPAEVPLAKSRAVFFVACHLDWPWRAVSVFRWLPTPLLDWVYDRVARSRGMLSGSSISCPVPGPATGPSGRGHALRPAPLRAAPDGGGGPEDKFRYR